MGEDCIIFGSGEGFYFSVIAVGKVIAYEINKHDILTKLPQQFVKHLEKSSAQRKEWVRLRMQNIQTTVQSVMRKVEDKVLFDSEKDRGEYYNKKSLSIQKQLNELT